MPRSLLPIGTLLTLVVTGLGTAACASSQPSSSGMAGVAPMLSVERFLQAVNTQDLDAMSRIFGNASGPIAEQGNPISCGFRRVGSWIRLSDRCLNRQEIELRMNAIGLILRHDDYRVRGQSNVPGRRHPTTRIGVDLIRSEETYTDVPFIVVQDSDGRWMVEEIGLERVTGRR